MTAPMEVNSRLPWLASFFTPRGDALIGNSGEAARSLDAVYYDTPAHALSRRGVALRLRQDRGSWTQAIKAGERAGRAAPARRDRDARGSAGSDLSRVGDSVGKIGLRRWASKLGPVFRESMQRLTRSFLLRPAAIKSLDRGVISADKARIAVNEWAELQAGPAWRLFEFAPGSRSYPVRIEHRSKAERGYGSRAHPPHR